MTSKSVNIYRHSTKRFCVTGSSFYFYLYAVCSCKVLCSMNRYATSRRTCLCNPQPLFLRDYSYTWILKYMQRKLNNLSYVNYPHHVIFPITHKSMSIFKTFYKNYISGKLKDNIKLFRMYYLVQYA